MQFRIRVLASFAEVEPLVAFHYGNWQDSRQLTKTVTDVASTL